MAKRQESLELELRATKNTVIVLSKRVSTLEIEFARLRSLLKRSILLPRDENPSTSTSFPNGITVFSADAAGTSKKAQATEPNVISVSDSSDDEDEVGEVEIDDSTNTAPDLISPQRLHDSNEKLDTITIMEIPTNETPIEIDNDDDALEGKIRIKSPMKLLDQINASCPTTTNAIWSNFIQTDMITKGKKSVVMVCKFCKGVVNARIDLLRHHLNECSQFKKGSLTTSVTPPNADADEDNVDMDDNPGTSISMAEDDESPVRNKHGGGRKKLPIWKNFITIQNEKTNGRSKRPSLAVCKGCKQEVAAKAQRLQSHMKICPSKKPSRKHK